MTTAARSAIAAQLGAIVSANRLGLPIQTDPNLSFTPPNNAPWMRLTIKDGDERAVGVGGDSNPLRTPVVAIVDVFVPGGTGDGEATDLAAIVKDGFRRWSSGDLRWAGFQSGTEGRDAAESSALYLKQVVIVFTLSSRG